jgi:hypothetical protein
MAFYIFLRTCITLTVATDTTDLLLLLTITTAAVAASTSGAAVPISVLPLIVRCINCYIIFRDLDLFRSLVL